MQWRINNYRRAYHGVTGLFDINIYIPPITPHTITVSDPNCFGYLYITLKIFYQKDDTGSGVDRTFDRTSFATAPWPDSQWTNYLNRVRTLSTFWDSRFWLVLNEANTGSSEYRNVERFISISENLSRHPVSGGQQLLVRPRTILCKFNLEIVSSAAAAHKHIRVAYIVDRNTRTPAGVDTYTNRSNASYYDNGDAITDSNGYNTIIHELGHAIGLPHIGVETSYEPCLQYDHWYGYSGEGNNSTECYQGPLANDIMGGGGELHWQDALPWRLALEQLTAVPFQYYTVHQMPMLSHALGELIVEGTPRWREFHNGTSWW